MERGLDFLAFTSLWVALAAAALCAAAGRALEVAVPPVLPALALTGTLAVYTVDRLRDLPRDRDNAPARSAFVERHRRALVGLAAGAAAASAVLVLRAGPAVALVAAAVAGFGFAHRRLKHRLWAKPLYLTGAWTAVAVGFPAAAAPAPEHVGRVAGVVGLTVLANVILSNLRDGEGAAGRLGRRRALTLAGAVLVPALALALWGPAAVRPLVCLPGAMALAVAFFRPGERYGLLAVDGALLAGALLSLGLGGASGA